MERQQSERNSYDEAVAAERAACRRLHQLNGCKEAWNRAADRVMRLAKESSRQAIPAQKPCSGNADDRAQARTVKERLAKVLKTTRELWGA